MIQPAADDWNFTPSDTELVSVSAGIVGLCERPKIEHGHETVTGTWVVADWMLPLSSVARTRTEVALLPLNEPV